MTPGRRLARTLQRMREERGLTQAQLAEKAGISRDHLSRIENRYADPAVGTLLRLAQALKVKLVDLVK